jgi:hypothetical protein
MIATLNPFESPVSGAYLTSAIVDKKTGIINMNTKPDINENILYNKYALKSVQDNINKGEPTSKIKDSWVRVNQQYMDGENSKRRKAVGEAEQSAAKNEIAYTDAESINASETDTQITRTSETDGKGGKKLKKFNPKWKKEISLEDNWKAASNNLHAEDKAAADGVKLHGSLGSRQMFTTVSNDKLKE